MATQTLQPGARPANAELRHVPDLVGAEEPFPFRAEIAEVTATISQAESILDLISSYGDAPPAFTSAVSGAATVMRSAMAALEKIEIAADYAKPGC